MAEPFDIHTLQGLSAATAAERLRTEGFNELPSARPRGFLAMAWEVMREPMFLLLVACGVIYLALGDTTEALMLLGFVFVVMGITFYQERKTEHALEALRDLSSPRASVIRDGQQTRIAGREVVRDDLLLLREGDRVPADALLLHTMNLSVDESLLTGESVPVRKQAATAAPPAGEPMHRPGGDDTPCLFSGTLVVQGQGVAEVRATGVQTELGRIGKALQQVTAEETLLQQETRRVVKRLAVAGLALCVLVIVLYGLTQMRAPDPANAGPGWLAHNPGKAWLDGILAGLTLAMAMLPEEFPVVLTIFLGLGAWRISRQQVLTRRIPSIETLGAATVLCTDKTGTLTQNRMTVSRLAVNGETCDLGAAPPSALPEPFHALVEYGVLASQRDPFDPMEKAIHRVGQTWLAQTEHIHDNWELVREYPLSRELLALSHVWRSRQGDAYVIAAKGAPEAIADLCHLPPERARVLAAEVETLAAAGLRVLGVARAQFQQTRELPGQQHDFPFEFIGLLGLADPVRPTVPAAIRECRTAGIRVVMITGDYAGTARNIAREIALPPGEILTGPELATMDDETLRRRIHGIAIFARVVPEQKLRIVEALKACGEIVAMTGDGVNDAPALKAAHIGIAMGARGTDVARESAALVLLDDDFASIVQAIRLGRRIFDNIRKAIAYIFAIHVPIAGMSLLPVLLGFPLILLPVHILFLELIIDPACSTIFEAEQEESDIMQRPPRNPHEPLFHWRSVLASVLQGVSVLTIVGLVFGCAWYLQRGEPEARALSYTTLIVANLGLILSNRSRTRTILEMLRTPNQALWWVLGGATLFLTVVLTVPALRDLFRFAPLHVPDLAICLTAGVLSILAFELAKRFRREPRHYSKARHSAI
jgi:Ca2+-transporting ATPase